ncbi:MAG: YceI family protein [Bacteroidetes bacterium]|nr:YceI family protein [Bacteroidota bacterium]
MITYYKTTLTALILSLSVFSQNSNLYPSTVKLETKVKDSTWHAVATSVVQVSEATSEMAFRMPIQSIDTDNPSVDSALSQIKSFVYLRGDFPITSLSFSSANNENDKDYSGKAFLTINSITKQIDYTVEVYNYNNNGDYNVGVNTYQVRIGLSFEFDPEDFKLNNYCKPLVDLIKIEVSNGFVNKLNMDGETIFNQN